MGYEIVYHFRKKLGPGEYSEEVTTESIIVGEPDQITSLGTAANKIFAKLARPNISVDDVEVYEFTKKKLSFRFADDGIVISNKKFKFDDGPEQEPPSCDLTTTPDEPDSPDIAQQLLALLKSNPQVIQQIQNPDSPLPVAAPKLPQKKPVSNRPKPPLRFETYDPVDSAMHNDLFSTGKPFTVGKTYPILEEKMAGHGILYSTVDDKGKPQWISDKYFNLIPAEDTEHSENDDFFRPDTKQPADKSGAVQSFRNKKKSEEVPLYWGELAEGDFPEIR